MRKNNILKGMALTVVSAAAFHLYGQTTLVHYWNFNDSSSLEAITTPNTSLVSGAAIQSVVSDGASSEIAYANGTGQNFNTENLNARNGDPSGTHLRYNNPIGGTLIFSLPTTDYENIVVKFATRRSGSGAGTQKWYYSANGTDYVFFQNIIPQDANPQLATLDFSSVAAAENNPNFKIKVEFETGDGGNVGNNRFDNFTVDADPVGGTDTTPPSVTYNPADNTSAVSTSVNPTLVFSEEVRRIDDSEISSSNAADLVEFKLNNASGTSVPFTAEFSDNTITLIPDSVLATGQQYYFALKPNTVEDFSNNAVTETTQSIFTTGTTKISFEKTFEKISENAGTHTIVLNVENPAASSVNVVVKGAPYSTADSSDFNFATQTLSIVPGTNTYTLQFPVTDDSENEQEAEYAVLSLENPSGLEIGSNDTTTLYIIDNDKPVPSPSNEIELNYIGSFDPSGNSNSSTEIVVHDKATQRLFTISSVTDVFDIIDFSDPTSPSVIKTVDMSPYGGITSIAVKNGILAAASPNADVQSNGSVVFFDTDGNFLKQVTVGALPDMVTFTPDGTKVLSANEGEPNDAYTTDPEGSVSIIDISGGIESLSQSDVTTLYFTQYNDQESALISSGIRKINPNFTFSQNLEPEYITITSDSKKAYVILQENNAFLEINLETLSLSDLWALGTKDMSLPGNGFDASDNNGEILIANWPVKTFYTPDAIASYSVNGTNYIVTANEGDEKDIDGFSERTTVGANGYKLDAAVFPNASALKKSYNLGRFRVTSVNGNTDSDSEYEEIYAMGSRSFAIFNADTKSLVYDSGDDFERYTAANWTSLFNADNEANGMKVRSRAKGPEPEGIALAEIEDKTYAFISLERIGGVMVYDITDPQAPVFTDYKNPRSTSAFGGDNGPEGITYIAPENSSTGKGYVIVANEISGTLSIYEIDGDVLSSSETQVQKTFSVFPNPVNAGNTLYFNRASGYELYDISGKLVKKNTNALTLETNGLTSGVYLLKTDEGITKRIIVK